MFKGKIADNVQSSNYLDIRGETQNQEKLHHDLSELKECKAKLNSITEKATNAIGLKSRPGTGSARTQSKSPEKSGDISVPKRKKGSVIYVRKGRERSNDSRSNWRVPNFS
jgi:hypothetical protein